MLRALVVVTIGLLLSGCALDAMGRGTPSWSAPPPPAKSTKPGKIIKQVAVVPAPVADPAPKRIAPQGKAKEKKKKWFLW